MMRKTLFLTAAIVAVMVSTATAQQNSRKVAFLVDTSKFSGLKLVLIPDGEFQMGSPETEDERHDSEKRHPVRITKPFYLGKYEVTQAEFEKVMGFNPSRFDSVSGEDTGRFPVESVTWYDAVEFCNRLSERDGLPAHYRLANIEKEENHIEKADVTVLGGRGYRLPTEAEWEYACRAGTTTPFHFGNTNNGREANVNGNYPYGTSTKGPRLGRTTTVGSYAANRFGLYDMHGNVYEWCQDWYDRDYYAGSPMNDPVNNTASTSRVLRGGSWGYLARYSRSADRYWITPDHRLSSTGFRVARTP